MHESQLEKIEKQTRNLSFHEHIKLMEVLAQQLRIKSGSAQHELDWTELYGLGKGLWGKEDAQDYVNKIREERL